MTLPIEPVVDVFDRATDRFAAQLERAPAGAGSRAIPGMEWTVEEAAAHVLSGLRAYGVMGTGGPSMWQSFDTGPADNAIAIAATPERDLIVIAGEVRTAAKSLREIFVEHDEGTLVWQTGVLLPTPVFAAIGCGELLLHGHDIAKGLGTAWPIAPTDAAVLAQGTLEIAPYFVDPERARGVTRTYELRLRQTPHYTLAFNDGTVTIAASGAAHADCRINAQPLPFVLLAYGRVPMWNPIAKGQMVAWGRKPWLGLQLPGLLRKP